MREQFPGYYSPTKEDFELIWREGLFVPDANVLLDVFRFSDETVAQLFSTFERLGSRLWLPYQAALEYHRNLTGVIVQQHKLYADALKSLQQFRGILANPREHPFVENALLDEVSPVLSKLEEALHERQTKALDVLTNNPEKERLAKLFDGKLSQPYAADRLTELYTEGAERYSKKIPPGYEDAKDKAEPERYGDWIMWMQMIDKAGESKQPMVLITRDVKEDWFVRVAGRTVGPRPELIAEMRNRADVQFHIYTTTSFLQFANEYLGTAVTNSAIQEVAEAESHAQLQVYWENLTRSSVMEDAGETDPVMAKYNLDWGHAFLRSLAQDTLRKTLGIPDLEIRSFKRGTADEYFGDLSDGRKCMIPRGNFSLYIIYRRTPGGDRVDEAGPGYGESAKQLINMRVRPGTEEFLDSLGSATGG